MENEILYQLTTKDFQDVAEEELGRKLSSVEIDTILNYLENRIEWYSIISQAIDEKIRPFHSQE